MGNRAFVIAQSFQQAREWVAANRYNPNNFRYVATPENLRGVHGATVHLVGQYVLHKHWPELGHMLPERACKTVIERWVR